MDLTFFINKTITTPEGLIFTLSTLALCVLLWCKAYIYILTWASLREKLPCRLVILGEGEKEKELQQLATDFGIVNDVAFLGFPKNPFKFMVKSAVFVLPSLWEGFPNVILEAMACCVPVVSTNCQSGPNEIIVSYKNGILVQPKDEEILAKEILKILTNPAFAISLALQAKSDIIKYDVKNIIDKYEHLLLN